MKNIFLMGKNSCRFSPSCSKYAQEAIKEVPFYIAIPKIIWRVLRCNPFTKGGYDPVIKENYTMKGAGSE
ncbi:hypothetical protein CHISP_1322 [Chitinispirillum alkaliphilum]|nr:hypothetical protein CHISP_1322 [Chitinispirillum alkaliphilum]